jgi:hypothetical protein
MKRRELFSTVLAVTGLVAIFPTVVRAERKRGGTSAAATGPVLIDKNDPAAKAVNYGASHKDVTDKTLQTERSGTKWADQSCLNCAFYDKSKEVTVGGVKAGPCSMPFAVGKVVHQTGWCSTWAKKG